RRSPFRAANRGRTTGWLDFDDVGGVANQIPARTGRPMVCRSPEANPDGNPQSAVPAQKESKTICEGLGFDVVSACRHVLALARKTEFPKAVQTDLRCPVLVEKIFHFAPSGKSSLQARASRLTRGAARDRHGRRERDA